VLCETDDIREGLSREALFVRNQRWCFIYKAITYAG